MAMPRIVQMISTTPSLLKSTSPIGTSSSGAAPGSVLDVVEESELQMLLERANGKVLVDFYAEYVVVHFYLKVGARPVVFLRPCLQRWSRHHPL